MMTYDKVLAVQEHRFGRHIDELIWVRRSRGHATLRQLLNALSGRLADLGIRGRDAKTRPASPAY